MKAIPDRMSALPRVPSGTALRDPRRRPAFLAGRRAAIVAAVAIAAVLTGGASLAATTYLAGRQDSDKGNRQAVLLVTLDFNTQPTSTTGGGGFVVVDGVLAGSQDRIKITGGGFADYIGRTFYAGLGPILDQEYLNVELASLADWEDALDSDGTIDEELGVVFGEVRDASGAPVAGATVTITPDEGGHLFYFDDAGEPSLTLTETSSSGRFVFLDVPPGTIAVNAALLSGGPQGEPLGGGPAGTLLARAYGRVVKSVVTGLLLDPVETIGGAAVSETGAPVAGALIEWDFDTDFAAFANGAGQFTIAGLAPGLEYTLRGSATGFRPALTYRRSRKETADPANIAMNLVSEGAYATWGTSFTPPQNPSLGMIVGRVLDSDGSPLAGAVVTLEPEVGQVHYFDAAGQPSASLVQTTASGMFIVLNVPLGNVTLSTVGPGQLFRRELAPSQAGAVTRGETRGLPLVTVRGKVRDEQQKTSTVALAVVRVVEFPQIGTIAGSDPLRCDSCFSLDVPVGEMLTFSAGRTGFKTSLTFTRESSATPLPCNADDPGGGTPSTERGDCVDLFLISDIAYTGLYTSAQQVANRGQGLVAAGVFFSNGNLDDSNDIPTGALGLKGQLSPNTALPRYLPDGKLNDNAITTSGSVQFLNAGSSVAGLTLFDPRNDEATLAIMRIVPDSVTLTDEQRVDCDTHTSGVFANLYPCDGARFKNQGSDAFFIWDLGENIRSQVQFSTDPAFTTIAKTSGNKFLKKQFWRASGKTWKKIKKLAPSGEAVYWRILGRDVANVETTTAPFVFFVP